VENKKKEEHKMPARRGSGRKPIPTNLKLLMGNPGKQALPKGEPSPDINIPAPPTCLDGYAIEEWNRITPVLEALGIISDLTISAVIAYCDAYSDWRTATEELNRIKKDKGALAALIQVTFNKNVIPNQLKLVAKAARADMVKYSTEFGGTELSKTRLGISTRGNSPKSKFDGLLGVSGK
jgi:P27 family predicted phage terminase small subunit